jgi:uncharacterized membrane protein YphA (DoxX/SURF4 family)
MDERSKLGRIDERVSGWMIGFVRISAGLMWLANLEWKRPPDFGFKQKNGLYKYVDGAVSHPVLGLFKSFIKSVVMPNYTFFGWVTLITEALLAALLISGLFTRAAGLIGAALSVNILFSVGRYPNEWPWSYFLMIVLHLIVFATAAGDYLGVDGARRRAGQSLDRARLALGATALVVGAMGWFVSRSDDFTSSDGHLVGYRQLELKFVWFNQFSAILTMVLGVVLLICGFTRLKALALIGAAGFGLMCLIVLVQWRNNGADSGITGGVLGATGGSLGFWLMLCLGVVGTILPPPRGR